MVDQAPALICFLRKYASCKEIAREAVAAAGRSVLRAESLIRTLSEFKNDKIISLDGRKVEIKSLDIVNILSKLG